MSLTFHESSKKQEKEAGTNLALFVSVKKCSDSLKTNLHRPIKILQFLTCGKITARKTIFSFSTCSEKMVFSKKLHWNMIFFVLSGKMIFLFPENMVLLFRREMKDDLSQKKNMKI